MSRRHQNRRKPLPELSPAQLIDRDARRLCYAMASASPASTWLTREDLVSRARADEGALACAVGRGWLKAEGNPVERVMLTKLGISIAADQRVAPKRRRA